MRVIMVDPTLADKLWSAVKEYLPVGIDGCRLVEINDHFRFSRYHNHGGFPTHCDGKNYAQPRAKDYEGHVAESLLTLNIFLNDDFEGGETEFFHPPDETGTLRSRCKIEPLAGRAALFWADQLHRGNPVTAKGTTKYLLRADVMGIRE